MTWPSHLPLRRNGVAGVDSDVANTENDMQATLALSEVGDDDTSHSSPSRTSSLISPFFVNLYFTSSFPLYQEDFILDQEEIWAKSGRRKGLKLTWFKGELSIPNSPNPYLRHSSRIDSGYRESSSLYKEDRNLPQPRREFFDPPGQRFSSLYLAGGKYMKI